MKKSGWIWVALWMLPMAHAGEWGSTGGEFLGDLMNPWFVKNVSTLRYCVDVDRLGFSADPARVRTVIGQAIAYWKQEFRHEKILGIGQQSFVEVSGACTGSEDLRFQFGYGTLSAAQLQEFKKQEYEPEDFVAVTVRTEYDRKALRGKGFLFLSSDRGDHPYNHGQGVATNLWQHDGVLYRVLIHELGHLFGVPHTASTPMAHDYPENVLRSFANYRNIGVVAPFFMPNQTYTFCGRPDTGWPVPVPADTHCLILGLSSTFTDMELLTENAAGKVTPIGSLKARGARPGIVDFPVKLVFSKEQTVFPVMPGEKSWNGPSRQSYAVYFDPPQDMGIQSLLLDLSPSSIRIHMVKNGTLLLLTERGSEK
jgi:hypothetical protein